MTGLVIGVLVVVVVLLAVAVAAEQRRAERADEYVGGMMIALASRNERLEHRVAELERALGKFSTGSTPGGRT